jgi:hypothetical protein
MSVMTLFSHYPDFDIKLHYGYHPKIEGGKMKKPFQTRYLLFLLMASIIVGCVSQNSSELTEDHTLPSPTITNTITATPTKQTPQELKLKDSQELLLSVTTTEYHSGICFQTGSTEIWATSFPFTKKKVLLAADTGVNYLTPTYSPDGEWIAYIAMKPYPIVGGAVEQPDSYDNGSLWIMRKDGTEKKQISSLFDTPTIYSLYFCTPFRDREPMFTWSPDGNYIFFEDLQHYENDVYRQNLIVINVSTKETFLIASAPSESSVGFSWLNDYGSFVYEIDGNLWMNKVTEGVIDPNAAQPLPNRGINGENQEPILDIASPITESHDSYYKNWSIWEYDISKETWVQMMEYDGFMPIYGDHWGIYTTDDEYINIFDLKSFWVVGSVRYDDKIDALDLNFSELQSLSGHSLVSVLDTKTNDIWGIDIIENEELIRVVNWSLLNPEGKVWITSFDWSP